MSMYDTAKSLPASEGASRRSLQMTKTLFIIVTALFLAGSGALFFYITVSRPADLNAQATAVVHSMATSQTVQSSPQHIYAQATSKPPTFRFPLSNQVTSSGQGWNTDSAQGCTFASGAYHLRTSANKPLVVCQNTKLNDLGNFALQVQMTILSGFAGGVIVRSPGNGPQGYLFEFTPNGLYATSINSDAGNPLLNYGKADINPGIGESNLITVIAQGKHLAFYINKQFVIAIDDGTLHSGSLGFFTNRLDKHLNNDVAFSDAQLWRL